MRAGSFEEALDVANSSVYKLTGGVFSRKPAHLEAARREFRVGNLYLNRGITGALVGRQPFGGFGLSGVGSKAGGADYLLHFVEPRCCDREHHAPRLRAGVGRVADRKKLGRQWRCRPKASASCCSDGCVRPRR